MVKNSGNEVGRPLWKIELNKKTPAGAEYLISSSIGSNEMLLKTRTKSFRNCLGRLNQTTQTEVEIKKKKTAMKTLPEEGIASYDINLNQTKKTLKVFTFPKSTKNVLWQEGNPFLYLIYV
jgi:hypothetical protein